MFDNESSAGGVLATQQTECTYKADLRATVGRMTVEKRMEEKEEGVSQFNPPDPVGMRLVMLERFCTPENSLSFIQQKKCNDE